MKGRNAPRGKCGITNQRESTANIESIKEMHDGIIKKMKMMDI
jgi:hypothetical protein